MMGVNHSNSPALLTSKVISFVNSGIPFFIVITATIIGVLFSRCICFTLSGTILLFIAFSFELFTAIFAYMNFSGVERKIASAGAESFILAKIFITALKTFFHNSMIRHIDIISQLERMSTAFPELEIKRISEQAN
jgi:hypothetical protein